MYGRIRGERERERESKMAELVHTGVDGADLQLNLSAFLLFGSKFPYLYNIPGAHANSRGHISFSLPPTQRT